MSIDDATIKAAKITAGHITAGGSYARSIRAGKIECSSFDPSKIMALSLPVDKNMAMINRARRLVAEYFNARCDKTENFCMPIEQVYVVWFCKILKNWKALLSTDVPDGMYYELTYNGDSHETYIDAYKKFENVTVPDETK